MLSHHIMVLIYCYQHHTVLFHQHCIGSTWVAFFGFPSGKCCGTWYLALFFWYHFHWGSKRSKAIPKCDLKTQKITDWIRTVLLPQPQSSHCLISKVFPKLSWFIQQSFILLPSASSETKFDSLLWQTATYWAIRTTFLRYPSLFLCVGSFMWCRYDNYLHWGGTICSGKLSTRYQRWVEWRWFEAVPWGGKMLTHKG